MDYVLEKEPGRTSLLTSGLTAWGLDEATVFLYCALYRVPYEYTVHQGKVSSKSEVILE